MGLEDPQIEGDLTVRQWRAERQRHTVLYRGPFDAEKLRALGDEQQVMDGRNLRWHPEQG